MPRFTALVVTIFVLAIIDTWVFTLPPLATLNLQVWMSFIAWGVHFMAGGKMQGVKASFLSMSFGALIGLGAALSIPHLPLGSLAAPVAVGIGAAVIVIASKLPLLEAIPAGFYGFAAIFAMLGLTKGLAPISAIGPTIMSIIIGGAFGYVSELVIDALAKKDPAPAPAAA